MWFYNSVDLTFFFIVGGTVALVVLVVVAFVTEVRRVGATPASEWYNDHTVPTPASLPMPRVSRRPHGTSKAA